MKYSTIARTAILLSAITLHPAAKADIVAFSGSMSGIGSNGPDASCAPLPFRGTINPLTTTGTSSLGAFTYSHNICNSGINGPLTGTFAIDFGTDSFLGTMTGITSPSGTPALANLNWSYVITGGTGRFLDATGAFSGIGTTDARNPPPVVSLVFTPVPEPGTWAMMLLGFGLTGASLRRARWRGRQQVQSIA